MNSDLPVANNSVLLRYDGVLFKSAYDVPAGSPLYPLGRMLLGTLRNRLALGGIQVGAQKLTLPNGDSLIAIVQPGLNKIVLVSSQVVDDEKIIYINPFFLIYPCSSEHPLGYGIDAKGSIVSRKYPYLIDEPVVKKFDDLQFPCISKLFYRWATPNEYTVYHPYHYPYGNQYVTIGRNVFTWWASGYGDLPILNVRYYSEATRFNQVYMPILCVEEALPYIYLAQNFYGLYPVDNRLYANGKAVFALPYPAGKAIIAGVGQRKNGDLIVAVAAVGCYEFFLFRGKELTRIDEPFFIEGYADRSVIFNEDATEAALLCELNPDKIEHSTPPVETLHCVTFSIATDKNTGKYSYTVIGKTAYYQKDFDNIEVATVVDTINEYEEDYLVYLLHTFKFYNYEESTRTRTNSTRFPVAVFYVDNELKYIELQMSSNLTEYGRGGVKNDSTSRMDYLWPGVISYVNITGLALSRSGSYYETAKASEANLYIDDISIGAFGNVSETGTWETFASHPGLVGRVESQVTNITVVSPLGEPPVNCYQQFKCNHFGTVDYLLKEDISIVKREFGESRSLVAGYLRYVDAKKQFVVHHQIAVETSCSGADEESTKRDTVIHYSFIPGGVSWDQLHEVTVYDVPPSGKEFDVITETVTSSFVITYLHADKSIRRRQFSERVLINGSISGTAGSSLATTPQLFGYSRYTTADSYTRTRSAPKIHDLIDHPYWLATLSYRVDPTLSRKAEHYESTLAKEYGTRHDIDELIYLGNEHGLFYVPGPSALYNKGIVVEYDHQKQSPIISSFPSASEGVGQIYPIGWGFDLARTNR